MQHIYRGTFVSYSSLTSTPRIATCVKLANYTSYWATTYVLTGLRMQNWHISLSLSLSLNLSLSLTHTKETYSWQSMSHYIKRIRKIGTNICLWEFYLIKRQIINKLFLNKWVFETSMWWNVTSTRGSMRIIRNLNKTNEKFLLDQTSRNLITFVNKKLRTIKILLASKCDLFGVHSVPGHPNLLLHQRYVKHY